MDALLLVHKPLGISSTKVGTKIKKLLGIKRVGHAGTLDLEASGLLLILLGSACRLQSHILVFHKEYEGNIRFGLETETDDIFGTVMSYSDTSILDDPAFRTEAEGRVKNHFSGIINQTAPRVSAKKSGGVPDYKRVRSGEVVTPKQKEVEVEVLDFTFIDEKTAKYHVRVSSGFYVRSFARDVGVLLGVSAVAESISRTSIGPFNLSEAFDCSEVNDAVVLKKVLEAQPLAVKSIADVCSVLPYEKIFISDQLLIEMVKNGNLKALEHLEIDTGYFLIYGTSEPIAIVKRLNEVLSYEYVFPLS